MSADPDAIAAEWPAVLAFVLTRMEGRADAEDVAALTIERALSHAAQYQPREGSTLRSWLYTIARNTMTDYWRRRGHVQTAPLVEFGRATTDAGNARHAALIDVQTAMASLEGETLAFAHLLGQGVSQHKAARAMGVAESRTTAWRRGHAYVTLLRAALEPAS